MSVNLSAKFSRKNHPLFEGLRQERENPQFSDFLVTVENRDFKCHRVVLAASSDFFKAALGSGWKEEVEGKVLIKGISADIFALVLDWMYQGDPIITKENVFEVLLAVDQLQILFLVEAIEDFLTKNLCIDNVVRVLNLSKSREWEALSDASWNFLLQKFDSVPLEEFSEMTVASLKELIRSDDLKTSSEDNVVWKILNWSQHPFFSQEKEADKESVSDDADHKLGDNHKTKDDNVDVNDEKDIDSEEADNGADDSYSEGNITENDCNVSADYKMDTGSNGACVARQNTKSAKSKDEGYLAGEKIEKNAETCNIGVGDFTHYKKQTENDRGKYFIDLLRSCKYYLLSSDFLWQTLDTHALIQSSAEGQRLVKDILRYKMRLDRHQHEIPKPALHRKSDKLTDVTLCIFSSSIGVQKHTVSTEGNWRFSNFGFPPENPVISAFTGGVFYNRCLYFEACSGHERRIYEYDCETHALNICHHLYNAARGATLAILPIRNCMVALRSSDDGNCIIETMRLPCKLPEIWNLTGVTSVKDMEVECVSNINSTLVIFWKSSGSNSLCIECYVLDLQKSFILQDPQLSPSTCVKTFKKEDDVFALQGDGILWRLKLLDRAPYLELVQERQLWTSQEKLKAVILSPKGLHVIRRKPEPFVPVLWCEQTSLDGVFSEVFTTDSINSESLKSCIHAVVDNRVVR